MGEARKLSNSKIATMVGVSESLVSRWKAGERKINPEVAIKLGRLFKVNPAKFVFNGKGDLADGEVVREVLEREVKPNNNC